MGVFKMSSGDSGYIPPSKKTTPNPNPFNWTMDKVHTVTFMNAVVVTAIYPDCTTYEGKKIMVINGCNLPNESDQLDPHFFNGSRLLARFKPTKRGFKAACMYADSITFSDSCELDKEQVL